MYRNTRNLILSSNILRYKQCCVSVDKSDDWLIYLRMINVLIQITLNGEYKIHKNSYIEDMYLKHLYRRYCLSCPASTQTSRSRRGGLYKICRHILAGRADFSTNRNSQQAGYIHAVGF